MLPRPLKDRSGYASYVEGRTVDRGVVTVVVVVVVVVVAVVETAVVT